MHGRTSQAVGNKESWINKSHMFMFAPRRAIKTRFVNWISCTTQCPVIFAVTSQTIGSVSIARRKKFLRCHSIIVLEALDGWKKVMIERKQRSQRKSTIINLESACKIGTTRWTFYKRLIGRREHKEVVLGMSAMPIYGRKSPKILFICVCNRHLQPSATQWTLAEQQIAYLTW